MSPTNPIALALLAGLVCAGGCDDSKSNRSAPSYSTGSSSSDGGGGAAPGVTGTGISGGAAPAPAANVTPTKAAALAWARAVAAADRAGAKAASVGDEKSFAGLEQVIRFVESEKAFDAALKEKFGPDEFDVSFIQELPDEIGVTAEKHEGDTVTIWAYINDKPLVLKKQPDGGWKVDITQIAGDTELMKLMAERNHQLAADVRAGKYKSSDELYESERRKLTDGSLPSPPDPTDAGAVTGTPPPAPPAPQPTAPAAPAEGDGLD